MHIAFKKTYGESTEPLKTYFAPGRVNLIGEHLDYNGGLVLPAAITLGITATYRARHDNKLRIQSTTHDKKYEVAVNYEIEYNAWNDWANYPMGVVKYLIGRRVPFYGADILFSSNLPESSGLSSSAAVEVLTAYMILKETDVDMSPPDIAQLCKRMENTFIGVQCGIMDQFSVAMGKAGNAILLNCATLDYEYIPFELNDYRLLVMNTNKPRSLITSKYNERKQECERALQIIQQTNPTENLATASVNDIMSIEDETIRNRAKHVVTESLRVKECVKALKYNDLFTFGKLMNASHRSLKEDYEVTGVELDTLTETAQQIKGCLGARMTGAGFGGCAIALAHASAVNEITDKVSEEYFKITGLQCAIYETHIGDGVREVVS
jgi:galactokinase